MAKKSLKAWRLTSLVKIYGQTGREYHLDCKDFVKNAQALSLPNFLNLLGERK